jgi:hypothetical protein
VGTIEFLAAQLALALRPLAFAMRSEDSMHNLVADLGWILPTIPPSLFAMGEELARLNTSLANVSTIRRHSEFSEGASSDVDSALRILALDLGFAIESLHGLPSRLRAELPADYIAATHIDEEIEGRIFDWLLSGHIANNSPIIYRLLRLAGVIEIGNEKADQSFFQPEFKEHRIRWDRLLQLLDPGSLAHDVYGWGTPMIDGTRLFRELVPLSFALGMPAEFRYATAAFTQKASPNADPEAAPVPQLWTPVFRSDDLTFFICTTVLAKSSPDELQGIALVLVPSSSGVLSIPIGDELELTIDAALQVGTGAALILRPDRPPDVVLDIEGTTGSELTSGRIVTTLTRRAAAWETSGGISADGGTHVTARNVSISLGAEATTGNNDVFAALSFEKVKLVVAPPEDDGLLSSILPQEGMGAEFSLTLRWSREGVHFQGSVGLATTIPVNVTVGPLWLQSLDFEIRGDEGRFAIIAGLTAAVELSPVTLIIDHIGLTTVVRAVPGNLGPVDVDISFKLPTGIGLSVDAQGVSGGGFLKIDPPNYAGMLQLSYRNEIDLTAFALITTELPDGQDGFSLVIQIMAEFQPIQIGLGFALTGVGGLIGINRQLNEEGMKQAFKTHALDAFLFPKNPIKDAVKIIESIQSVMPPRDNYHVFGPMVQLYWGGSVRLVQFEVGIFIQIGGPLKIVVIGQAWSHLPQGDNPRLVIHVDVLGIIDFGEERLAIDAVLYDSKILSYTLDGQMAIRADWSSGEENFALSVGGFHPRFQEIPPGFPDLRRLVVAIGSGNPRLTLSMYLAITPNTLQVGARLELWAKKKGFTITGGASFDALFTFSPFSFLVIISIWVNIKRGWVDLGAWLELELSGPNPLIAAGYVKFKVGWFSKKVRFRKQFGDKQPEPLPEVSPVTALRTELENRRTIRFQLPTWASANLIFAETAESKIDPLSDIVISQNAVPLNLTMERFGGGRPPEGEEKLSVTAGLGDKKESATKALFAPEQFNNWSDDERLSAKPFEKFDAGIRFSGEYVIPEAHLVQRKVEYETILRESRSYRQTLAANDFRSLAVRATCIWQPTDDEAEFFVDWSLAGSGTFFKPLRKTKDKNHPNYVHVSDALFSFSNGKVKDGKFEEVVVDGESDGGMTLAEAIGTRKRVGLGRVIVRDRVDVGTSEKAR